MSAGRVVAVGLYLTLSLMTCFTCHMANTYRDHGDRLDLVICNACSTRTDFLELNRDEIQEHDKWHRKHARAFAGWVSAPGPVAGSRTYEHPGHIGWKIYDAGAGGVITAYKNGETVGQYDSLADAIDRATNQTGIEILADLLDLG